MYLVRFKKYEGCIEGEEWCYILCKTKKSAIKIIELSEGINRGLGCREMSYIEITACPQVEWFLEVPGKKIKCKGYDITGSTRSFTGTMINKNRG